MKVTGTISQIGITTTIVGLGVEGAIVQSGDKQFTDLDGNIYTTVTINGQEWIVENLRVTKYADNTSIAEITNGAAWLADTTGAYCKYDNDSDNVAGLGLLYNWYAVNKGLAYFKRDGVYESGWRVATKDDFDALSTFYSGNSGKLKESGTTYWQTPNTGADNASGLTVRGSGARDSGTGDFVQKNQYCYLWSFTDGEDYGSYKTAYEMDIVYNNALIQVLEGNQKLGCAVRCVRDL